MARAAVGGRRSLSLCAALLLLAMLPGVQAAGGRALAQQEQEQGAKQAAEDDPFSDAVQPQSLSVYQKQPQTNLTMTVIRTDVSVRLLGPHFVPFTLEHQSIIMKAFKEELLPFGPVQMLTYKEVMPDMSAPEVLRIPSVPAVEISFAFSPIYNTPSVTDELYLNSTSSYTENFIIAYTTYSAWAAAVYSEGHWEGAPAPEVLAVNSHMATTSDNFTLQPVLVFDVKLALLLNSTEDVRMTASQGSAVSLALERALLKRRLGTLVEIVDYSSADSRGHPLLSLEATVFACRENATLASPACEGRILGALLSQVLASATTELELRAAGVEGVDVLTITLRQPPPTPLATPLMASSPDLGPQHLKQSQPGAWVPWHLDRIDQRSFPLDGLFTPTADGTGVNVYIISSGILGKHEEFHMPGAEPGVSRVKPAWGFLGLDPVSDCPDHYWWHGYGTLAASLCCGLKLGAAKNATIHSVRFRESCFSSPTIWASGALPAAMDLVLSTAVRPAVVLIDTWWSPARDTDGNAEMISKNINTRLDSFAKNNIPVVAGAGQGLNIEGTDPCSNVIASHPAVISVASSDSHDQVTASGPRNSACIDIFAPGGGIGTGSIGASPRGVSNYTRIISRAFASASLVTGVVAQYLQLHPEATADQVKRELLGIATPGSVTDVGEATPNRLLFSNFSQPGQAPLADAPVSDGAGGSSTSAIVGGVVGACVVLAVVLIVLGIFAIRSRRRQQQLRSSKPLMPLERGSWEVQSTDIEICKRPDGSDWLLGKGRHSRVYKAMKGGVQVVAAKMWSHAGGVYDYRFAQDLATTKYASRDANITQFYGACIQGDSLMLITEFMEGGDLATALSTDDAGRLQWYGKGKEIMLDVVRGAHFLHANSIVHGDIKSKNILLGRDWRAKIGDVGVAQLMASQHSTPSGFKGTLAWAAPEMLLANGPPDAKSDIFSIGVVLWEVVTGELPIRGQLRSPRVPQECPQGVADAIQACMQVDPCKRPTAKDLYSILQACPPESSDSGSGLPASSIAGGSRDQSVELPSRGVSQSLEQSRDSKEDLGEALQQVSGSSRTGLGTPLSSAELALLTMDVEHIQHCTNSDGSLQVLGNGSFGSVYKVLLDGVQPLAAKVMDLGSNASVKVQETFLREAGLLWRLRHRNIVALTGVCISENKGYLFMELMEGGSLFHRLGVVGRSTMTRVLGWYNRGQHVALDIARGLHYLHSLKITHFDLKSGNVLLTKEFNAKLADVGLARVMSCTHHSLSHDSSVGTFAYMAPELMAGTKCTAAVDIFSLGVLIWEICTGMHPVRGQLEPLSVPRDCPQSVADLFLECTAPDPASRPTARDMVERLSAIIQSKSPSRPEVNASTHRGLTTTSCSLEQGNHPPVESPFLAMR